MDVALQTIERTPRTLKRTLKAYVSLTKPRVVELLLVVTAPTMLLAERGIPSLWLILATLVGGSLSAGSAGAFNCYLDRDIDRLMKRTKNRPLVTGELSDREALIFAWVLGAASILWLGLLTNWLAAALSFGAIVLYVVFYTIILKRRTPQNIVWGGVAGCMPVLIGWAAVTGDLSWPPVILYAWATVACSLLLIPIADMGVFYASIALVTGGWFIYETHRLYSLAIRHEHVSPMRVFHGSIAYLTLLFVAVGVDPLLTF